jgi:hypothetical protein
MVCPHHPSQNCHDLQVATPLTLSRSLRMPINNVSIWKSPHIYVGLIINNTTKIEQIHARKATFDKYSTSLMNLITHTNLAIPECTTTIALFTPKKKFKKFSSECQRHSHQP